MLSEPRTISLITELIHVPTVHSPERLRDVYNQVCRSCSYENFLRVPGGARIERREADGEGVSQLSLVADRIQLTEDHTGISVEQFGKRIVAVLSVTLPALQVPLVLVEQCTVRVIAVPNSFSSASEYLALSVFKIKPEDLEPLGRPTSVFGFRLVFPPTAKQPQNYNVRVESYVRDRKALYLESVGTFKAPIESTNLDLVEMNLKKTSDFIGDKLIPFLSTYDRRVNE